jgi:ubiquinone/menaquinone biosynthesis C-methylase UbiE
VLLCDNLSLPFRDDSFDAVLSVAVVHHFATTERRVGALRELARVLRIGGRLIITVWAMKQRHRKVNALVATVRQHNPKLTDRERSVF